MSPTRRILIPIDDSDACLRAVEHVGRQFPAGGDATIRLLHVVGPMPAALRASGGSADADPPSAESRELDAGQARWFADERTKAQPLFRLAERVLQDLGVDPNAIATRCCESTPQDDPVALILEDARAARCDTVVVGRSALPGLRGHFHRHLGDALRRRASGMMVEIIG